ncbi:MAG: hypothetical protein WC794_05345 [Candidatus Doudnabacteria bacterium]|jgi:hypothetical protein
MHDHNDNNSSGMMWMMAICCLAPFIFLLIAGKGLALQGFRGWALVVIALGLIGYHFWQMRKPHGGNQQPGTTLPEEDKNLPDQLK